MLGVPNFVDFEEVAAAAAAGSSLVDQLPFVAVGFGAVKLGQKPHQCSFDPNSK